MPIASHSGWLARTRATVAATDSGESTGIALISVPVAGLLTSIVSAVGADAPFVSVLRAAVPLSTTAPCARLAGQPTLASRSELGDDQGDHADEHRGVDRQDGADEAEQDLGRSGEVREPRVHVAL